MADFRPVEANKGHILTIHPGSAATPVEDANAEWVEIIADLSSDFANWRLQHLRGLWKPEVTKPVEWEWVYTWGSPAFVKAGEVYRIHSGSRARAATHPLADDLASGRKHVYAAGPIGAAKLTHLRGAGSSEEMPDARCARGRFPSRAFLHTTPGCRGRRRHRAPVSPTRAHRPCPP